MEATLGAPLPSPNGWFALIGGTFCSVMAAGSGSLSSVVVSAAVGAVVSYLTGLLCRKLFERKEP